MKKILSMILFVAFLSGCGNTDIAGRYTAQKTSFFATLKFTIELLDDGKALFHIPKIGPKEAKFDELHYAYDGETVSLWEKGKEDQIVLKVEEEGKILRLVSGVKGFPDVWTRTVEP